MEAYFTGLLGVGSDFRVEPGIFLDHYINTTA